jgi:glutamyl/glutaminyl-tRNA synthetase
LDFINGLYIREKSIEKLTELCIPYLIESGFIKEEDGGYKDREGESMTILHLQKIIQVSKTRMKKLSEISEFSDFFFQDKLVFDKNLLQWQQMTDGELIDSLSLSEKVLSEIEKWELKEIEIKLLEASQKLNSEKNYPEKNKGYLLWPLRVALSGKSFSPSPFEIAEILGKEKTLERIADAKSMLA